VCRTIKCPRCGEPFPLPSEWQNSQHRSGSPRGSAPRPKLLRVGDLVLNSATYDATRAGKEIPLNRTEYRLLESLMLRSGRVVSRNALVHLVWDFDGDVSDNLIDVNIHHLRKKVDRDHKVKLIKTVRKWGYAIRDPAKAR
jgi:DNA-binding response OmpR family regulator